VLISIIIYVKERSIIKDYTSVVLCTYNRAHLLKNSLICYEKQTMKNFELIILDDNSQDETESLVLSYRDRLNITYIKLQDKSPDEWRDAGAIINRGIKISKGEYIYITHPEVMICFDCLEKMNSYMKDNIFVNSSTYYLTVRKQEELHSVDWESEFYNIRHIKGFYDDEPLYKELDLAFLNRECTPSFTDTVEVWLSWVFGGMTRKTWKNFGGLNEYKEWGAVDVDFIDRRLSPGIATVTPADVFVLHQNHDRPFGTFKPTDKSLVTIRDAVKKNYSKKINFLEDMEI
jgi:glycosyltransferase involved in cell wall biosynthesis